RARRRPGTPRRRPPPAALRAPPQASAAQRKPAKICRRCGKSQLRKVLRTAIGRVAHEPPRSTLKPPPKCTSEYSRYGKASKPGYGPKSLAVHSHTSPII